MSRTLALFLTAAALGLFAAVRASAEPKHPHLHHALYEMKEAHKELKEAGHNFGGHKEKALEALDAAIRQTERALEAVGDPYKSFVPPPDLYSKYKNHQHLRHSLVAMREARTELKEAKHDFGGHREKAVHDIDAAIEQVEKCIKEIR